MRNQLPGLNRHRLVRLMRSAVADCQLDLQGLHVLTEAASGPYIVTPLLAALAGATVTALTRSTGYGSAEEITVETMAMAELIGVAGRIRVTTERSQAIFRQADIVTNSGHVRPLDAAVIRLMRPGAAIPLMYEAWEYREADLDLAACLAHGVLVAGTNERHSAINVFSYLGAMAMHLLHSAGVSVYGSRVLLLCDNDLGPAIQRGLCQAGANVDMVATLTRANLDPTLDAVMVALQPQGQPVLNANSVRLLAEAAPGAVLAQCWGDIDRTAARAVGVPIWPPMAPAPGHMAILPSATGPEPIIRLQAGGLKVGEVLARGLDHATAETLDYLQLLSREVGYREAAGNPDWYG
ncbi:MAG: hypothetical protein HGA19_13895, partial [Oscillochloris sp.]|nr:hypothetical protein [Oscillochloris sp.]